jgi:hypothetical protein
VRTVDFDLIARPGVVVPPVICSVHTLLDVLSGILTSITDPHASLSERDPRLFDPPGLSYIFVKAVGIFEDEGSVRNGRTRVEAFVLELHPRARDVESVPIVFTVLTTNAIELASRLLAASATRGVFCLCAPEVFIHLLSGHEIVDLFRDLSLRSKDTESVHVSKIHVDHLTLTNFL